MIHRWIPWKFIVKRAAKAYGIVDPLSVMARVRRFAQPSEVQEPIELLRAGIIFHARGLINTKAIQHNLDWVWPYWVERQFNPKDVSFIPRGFSFSHVNLTHRNWTAVGLPGLCLYPIIDPHGLFTPLFDGWSLDFWLQLPGQEMILPSRQTGVRQDLRFHPHMHVETQMQDESWHLSSQCSLQMDEKNNPAACMRIRAQAPAGSKLIVALRPYNPEGIQFIEKVSYNPSAGAWDVNGSTQVLFDRKPDHLLFSDYARGDVVHKTNQEQREHNVDCKVGMATAAALFTLSGSNPKQEINARIPLSAGEDTKIKKRSPGPAPLSTWDEALEGSCRLQLPDSKLTWLYNTAVRTLVLLSARDIVPGPYTYRRFWFRDACFMLHALLNLGFTDTVERIIQAFPLRQKKSGYFQSQAGEWDSNGQVLWLLDRFERLSKRKLDPEMIPATVLAVKWIQAKRLPDSKDSLHAGLLPAGFSAEHLGPNDYYYWDDLWGAAGLQSAAHILQRHERPREMNRATQAGNDFMRSIWKSIEAIPNERRSGGIPASPYRRLDAGAVGSLVADYPLQITPGGDNRIMNTVQFLMHNCFYQGGFFQDMIHSGINPYLTLCIAQSLLRAQDRQYLDLVRTVADVASPTGQWPEAIHPHTFGGCMGDGQHGWAACEWVMILRNMFVREEDQALIVGSGLDPNWLQSGEPLEFGPTLTPYGKISIFVAGANETEAFIRITGTVDPDKTAINVRVPGYTAQRIHSMDQEYRLTQI